MGERGSSALQNVDRARLGFAAMARRASVTARLPLR